MNPGINWIVGKGQTFCEHGFGGRRPKDQWQPFWFHSRRQSRHAGHVVTVTMEVVGYRPTCRSCAGVLDKTNIVDGGACRSERHDDVPSFWQPFVEMVAEMGHDDSWRGCFPLPLFFRAPQHMDALLAKFLHNFIRDRICSQILMHAGNHEHRHSSGAGHGQRHHQRPVLQSMNVAGHDVSGCRCHQNSVNRVQHAKVAVPVRDDLRLRGPAHRQGRDDSLCRWRHDNRQFSTVTAKFSGEFHGFNRSNSSRDSQQNMAAMQ